METAIEAGDKVIAIAPVMQPSALRQSPAAPRGRSG